MFRAWLVISRTSVALCAGQYATNIEQNGAVRFSVLSKVVKVGQEQKARLFFPRKEQQ